MMELRNASNEVMRLLGESEGVMCDSTVLVASNLNHSALISWQDLQKLHVISVSFPAVAAVASSFQKLKTKTLSAFL